MSRRVILAILFAALLMGMLTWTSNKRSAKAELVGVYIRADGSIEPSDVPILTVDNITYILTGSFNGCITVEPDNVILDGAGYTLQGPGAQSPGTGIFLNGRNNVTIENFNIEAFNTGIDILSSSNSIIRGNRIAPSSELVFGPSGLMLFAGSSNNTITRNTIEYCTYKAAIYLNGVSNNTIYENTLANNGHGIWIDASDNNTFYHNDFVSNIYNAYLHAPDVFPCENNTWDDGYPSGGNYWGANSYGYGGYAGADAKRGPYQNEIGSDGIGDMPYSFQGETDHYPLMKPYGGTNDIGAITTHSKSIIGEGYNTTVTTSVTIINYGLQTETFNFTFQTPTALYREEGLTLASRDSIPFTFEWNTTGFSKGNYTIEAYLTPVEGETCTSDNNQTIQITITIAGDVTSPTGSPDGRVDMRDIGAICNQFGTTPSNPSWNPDMDINDDDTVNMRDIGIACNKFGKT